VTEAQSKKLGKKVSLFHYTVQDFLGIVGEWVASYLHTFSYGYDLKLARPSDNEE